MLFRIWRTGVKRERLKEYEEFERSYSLPMFERQEGCLGVFFLRGGEVCAALSLWRSETDIVALDSSPTYQQTVARLIASGLLQGEQSVEIFECPQGAIEGGLLDLVGIWPPPQG
jgi:heme-degrading monooxygenase HmoA